MKKYFVYVIMVLVTIISCEKDDICIEDTTPNLIIRFYDNLDHQVLKTIQLDSIYTNGNMAIDGTKNTTLDSITIPLDLTTNITKFIIESNSVKDTIEFSYNRKDEFVSRSCGYKTIFESLLINNNTTNWIQSIEIINATVNNEQNAHLHIYH